MIKVNNLLDYIKQFRYKENIILQSLNELSDQAKRIVYYDGPKKIRTLEDLNSIHDNRIILTQTGNLYLDNLVGNFDYQQYSLFNLFYIKNELNGLEKLSYNISRLSNIISAEIAEITHLRKKLHSNLDLQLKVETIMSFSYFQNFIKLNILRSIEKQLERHENTMIIGLLEDPINNLESLFTQIENCFKNNFQDKRFPSDIYNQFLKIRNRFDGLKNSLNK